MNTTTTHRPLFEIAADIRTDWRIKTYRCGACGKDHKTVAAAMKCHNNEGGVDEIKGKSNVWFGAQPYLDAMGTLTSMRDTYGYDDAKSIVIYFLGNAQTWKGETAKAVKAELKAMLK